MSADDEPSSVDTAYLRWFEREGYLSPFSLRKAFRAGALYSAKPPAPTSAESANATSNNPTPDATKEGAAE